MYSIYYIVTYNFWKIVIEKTKTRECIPIIMCTTCTVHITVCVHIILI